MSAGAVAIVLAAIIACGRLDPLPASDSASQLVGPPNGLKFSASVSKSTFAVGDSATFRLNLENTGSATVTLHFSSGCQILPYITNADGVIVYPGGGAWGCTAALTSLSIAPKATITSDVTVRGARPDADIRGAVALGPGSYDAHGELGDKKGKSDVVKFTITQ